MSWSRPTLPLVDLLTIHARMERLSLVEKLQAAELHLRAAGLDPAPLTSLRTALMAHPLSPKAPMLPPTLRPAGPPGELRYLRVSTGKEARRG
jgi:hypothetical protein